MLDCIIVGTGPAGLSAALNLKAYEKDFLWFGPRVLSAKGRRAEKIANYPGLPFVSGEELFARFEEHIAAAGLEIAEKTVTGLMASGSAFMALADNEIVESKTVLLCTGVVTARPLPNEVRLLGRGVSYCATCDGFLYKGKKLAVIGGDAKFEHEAAYLANLASEVTYFPLYKNPRLAAPNIQISYDFPVSVDGDDVVTGLTLKSGARLAADGVFCLRGAIAPEQLMPGLETENGHIKVDRAQQTNYPGCFAAGDCTGRPYQFTKAVGEGNVAAHSCIDYLSRLSE